MESEIPQESQVTQLFKAEHIQKMEDGIHNLKESDGEDYSTPVIKTNDENPFLSEMAKSENVQNDSEINRIAIRDSTKKYENKVPSTSSVTSPRESIQKKWEWLPCNYELKREEKGTETYWSLTPIIQLVHPDSKLVPETDISFELERPFMYNPEVGWNWHKSWNLPNITINLKLSDPKKQGSVLPPADLKAQLLAVKVLLNRVEQVKLFDLGLKGSNIQDLSDGVCTFSGVKFSSTSYNNEGVKFHLVILVYIQEDSRNRACPKILYSKISPPIFVDSRKAARNSNIYKNKKISLIYFDSFPPDTFTKTFVKRNSKLNETKEEIIENSLGGLCHYFTAPNIRNKVKHPIFLASKFSNCVKLYYNSGLVNQHLENEEPSEKNLIYVMQKVFFENHMKKNKGDFANPPSKAFDNKYFILLIEEPHNPDSFALNKKIADYLEPIINEVLHVIFNSNLLPRHFELFPSADLVSSYEDIYPKLVELKNSFGPLEEFEDFEESKTNSASRNKLEFSPKDDINIKRERDYSSFEEDSDADEEDLEVAKAAVPQKKVKLNVGSRRSNRGLTEENIPLDRIPQEAKAKKTAAPKLKEKKPAKVAQPKAKKAVVDIKVAKSKVQPSSMNAKMEVEEIKVKTMEKTSPPIGKKQEQVSNPFISTLNYPNELMQSMGDSSAMFPFGLDMLANMQQQRSDQEKNLMLMNMMYPQDMGKQMMANNPLMDPMANPNLALYQQQILQAQIAQYQQQQQKQHQFIQLQQQLRHMQAKNGMELEKEKALQAEFVNKFNQGDGNMNFLSGFGMNKALNQQAYLNMLSKNQQYPLLTGNRTQGMNLQESYSPHSFNGMSGASTAIDNRLYNLPKSE